MATKTHKELKRYRFRIYHFDPKTLRLEATETCTTKPMLKKDYERVLKERIKAAKACCWENIR